MELHGVNFFFFFRNRLRSSISPLLREATVGRVQSLVKVAEVVNWKASLDWEVFSKEDMNLITVSLISSTIKSVASGL